MNRNVGQSSRQAQFNSFNLPDPPDALVLEVDETIPFAQLEQFILKPFRRGSQTESSGSTTPPQTTSFVLAARENILSSEPSEEPNGRSLAPEPGQLSRKHYRTPLEPGFVLVVEDDTPTEHLERYLLESAGYRVQAVASGEAALEVLEKASPALVLMDVGLEGMDGFTTCQRIREFSQVPIIMVTGKDRVEDQVRALQVGADDYLVKALLSQELTIRVAVLLRIAELRAAGLDQSDVQPEGLEDLYEGKVRVVAEVTGSMRRLIDFVGELRAQEQLSLLRLSSRQNKFDLQLRLRQPLPLKKMLLDMESVWKLTPADESEKEELNGVISLSLCQ